jgi:anti-sigma factor RsiW
VAWHQQAAWFHKLAAERQARSTPLLLDFEHNNPSHLTTTLINALEYPVVVPDLSRQGFELLGARVLIEDMRPLAQVFYRESNGILVSLLVALDMGPAVPAKAMAVDDFQMVAWRGERFAYVLTGDLEEERLFHLTTQVLNAVPN